jgi:hypothetical protein
LEDHTVRPLQLPIGARVSNRRAVDHDPVSISELHELHACEVCPIICDDGVWHTKSVDDVQEKLDGLLGIGFGDRFRLNPIGELVHRDKEVSETARGHPKRPDHVETPDHERPCEGDGLKRLRWQGGLASVELTPLARADDLLRITQYCRPIKNLAEGLAD